MNDKINAIGDIIFYTSVCLYISVFIGIVLIIAFAFIICKQISLRKQKKNSDDKQISKSLSIANIMTYILIAIIMFFMAFWIVCGSGK